MGLHMKKRISILIICLFALFLNVGLGLASSEGKIEKIQFETPTANEDRITFKLNGAHLPKIFVLKGDRPRVVFDFPDTFPVKSVQNSIKTDGTFIKQIRSAIYKDSNPKTRVVLDLAPGQDIDFEQNFDQATNSLVIRVFAVGTKLGPIMMEQAEQEPAVKQQTVEPAPEKKPVVVAETADKSEPETHVAEEGAEAVENLSAAKDVEPAVETETVVEPKPAVEVTQEPEQQIASIPQTETPSPEAEMKESTVIQPLSEIGDSKKQAAVKPSSPILYSIDFDDNSHRGEMILFKLNEFYPPVVFGIEENIPRIVCFFKGTSAGEELKDLIESNGQYVKAIRVGKYQNPDNIRVVLDLVPDKNYDLQQIFFKDDNLFMIIINTTGDKVSS